ncbi:MAG: UDP-N-acetylglucosamine 1-carboxyvinyltransferase [Eubacteriales bacterium]|nr:UDP-N-acetylglucosamine 1-carboxyvinyltransferase [Clostridiales bacterium]MDY5709835.1 UDP-N-acetylglucosamine 1-carboxyvinyltransferase [Eubacteriales bacterium]
MAYYRINGGKRLEGAVTISGAKNAALAIIPAVILSGESCLLENLPEIEDVRIVEEILTSMGADISRTPDGSMRIDPSGINTFSVTGEMVSSMRASYYLLGALLGRYKKAEIALPGGCAIGQRPIDQHIKGMRALGADIVIQGGSVKARADKLKGAEIYLDVVSVGATINIMLAAVAAEGQTIIANAAKEPHVVDVANFLNMMGANVKGAGTDVIRIQGGRRLHGCTYAVIPDQIEAGTFMIAAAATRGDVIINNVIPTHLEAISAKLMECGVTVTEGDDGRDFFIRVSADKRPRAVNIKTLPYPGFPTDLQQPMMALLATAEGNSFIMENIFENRFNHVPELAKMGACISISSRTATVEGVERLYGAPLCASDLRAGAALVIAALAAEGESTISQIHFIDRGYEFLEQKLRALGADITRIEE